MLDSMYKTMSISSGLYPNLDLWNANKLQLQLQLQLQYLLPSEPQTPACGQVTRVFPVVIQI